MLIGITSNISSCSGYSKSNTFVGPNVLPTTPYYAHLMYSGIPKMPLGVFWFYNKADF